MTRLDGHYRFREALVEALRRDVLGPIEEAELLAEEPATAYITGVLYPQVAEEATDLDERRGELDGDLAPVVSDRDEVPDTGVSLANRQMPSAMGLTFAVDPTRSTTIAVTAGAAVYEPVDEQGLVVPARRAERRSRDDEGPRWRRRPLTIRLESIDVHASGEQRRPLEGGEGLELRVRVRRPETTGAVPVTVTLINTRTAGRSELLDAKAFFQCGLRVTVPEGTGALVERRPLQEEGAYGKEEDELRVARLLHRHVPMFATGHGCAAAWERPASPQRRRHQGPAGTDALWSEFVPACEVLLTDSNPDVDEPAMLNLAEASTPSVIATLSALVDGYRRWVDDREAEVHAVEPDLRVVAQVQITVCRAACDRMASGVARLRDDPVALDAFRAANEAMADQRAQTVWIRNRRAGRPDRTAGRWRPFQIGFILLCLDGIVDPDHEDRSIADVLWFPTGGGKTEAYLGLIAFTTFLRRMRDGERGGGVTVLMRYTLRLLTLQQFERAAALICAMERLRRARPDTFGTEKISIGMWVGKAATPNTLKDAETSLKKLRKGERLQEENPVQLRACPWCGSPMDAYDYHVVTGAATMSITCRADDCAFRTGLPVHVVDEDVYAVRPTLVIATADKFAQVAWREQVARLFNREGAPQGTPPPELVIQDELHLISGPLGTLAGLYESAIDLAADAPKVVASTATIRRADEQGKRLFDREVRQFPPAGLDARDSWFAVEAPPDRKATRLYVGVLTPSTSQATLLIRTYAALLHHAAALEGDDRVRDAYWTLVGYFNSLRLLSAAELQVHADVQERLTQLATRDGVAARQVDQLTELTSRVESSEIPRVLQDLFVGKADGEAVDVVLATNMISVGVDVDRLGLMAVMGQPQATAEYIQATSRVGRRDPGLVVTMFNGARSRDRSHYEDFTSYHSALYRQVESTSVTPFSARARDRALHAVLVGLVRLLHPHARPNGAAAKVEDFLDEVHEMRYRILERVAKISPEEYGDTDVQLAQFVEDWCALATDNPQLLYEAKWRPPGAPARSPRASLLSAYGGDSDLTESAPTMWSLRDVDVESAVFLED